MKIIQYFQSYANDFLKNPNPLKLKILDRVLSQVIPFNIPHKFTIKSISENSIQVSVPWKRKNLNHVNSIHACAMATLGEYSAGLLLIRHFSIGNFRLILSKLEAEYFYQGKSELIGEARLSQEQRMQLDEILILEGMGYITMETIIKDLSQKHVSTIKTTWQLKNWKKVQTPL